MTATTSLRDIAGTGLDEESMQALLFEAADILAAIRGLRALDLTDIHPAVVFDPLLPWRLAER